MGTVHNINMDGTNVNLNWADFSAKLLDSLRETWCDDSFSDVTLVFDDETRIGANRTLLASISPLFKNVLKTKSSQNPYFFMFGLDSMMVKFLLDFVCTGQTEISKESLELFLTTAEKLKLKAFSDDIVKTNHDLQAKEDSLSFDENVVFNLDEEEEFLKDIEDDNKSVMTSDDVKVTDIDIPTIRPIVEEEEIKPIDISMPTYKPVAEPIVVGENEVGLQCFLCRGSSKNYKSLDDLHRHEKLAHSRGKSYKCKICDQDFHRAILLTQHERIIHASITGDSNSCGICGKSFKTEKLMIKHRDYSHPVPGKTFKCKMCQKESLTKNASNVHYYQAHSEERRKAFEGKI